uniref:Ribosomal protein S4 n=1 Tax=Gloeochaete wittrockiana TaxID=38269 RepID=A0A096Y6S6_9EUKA|nr:ribosomal protein S4 [Gloeochaete wittrockiana]AIM52040.1 ribosomal protein S4 [Gloeochaete wittrockiana]
MVTIMLEAKKRRRNFLFYDSFICKKILKLKYPSISQKQFEKYIEMSTLINTGDMLSKYHFNFFLLLEKRLDSIFHRAFIISSLFVAPIYFSASKVVVNRQLVSSRSFLVSNNFSIISATNKQFFFFSLLLDKNDFNRIILSTKLLDIKKNTLPGFLKYVHYNCKNRDNVLSVTTMLYFNPLVKELWSLLGNVNFLSKFKNRGKVSKLLTSSFSGYNISKKSLTPRKILVYSKYFFYLLNRFYTK